MNNPNILISARDLAEYVNLRERKAQISILKRIKPLGNGKKITELISRIANNTLDKKVVCAGDKKKNVLVPCGITVTVSPVEAEKDYSDIEQFMVRKGE